MRGPLLRGDVQAGEHVRLGLAVARQCGNGCQLAQLQVLARAPGGALNAPQHKRLQATQQSVARLFGQGKSGIALRRFVRGRQQVGAQGVAAALGFTVARRKVAGQAIAIEVGGQLCRHLLPLRHIAQAHGLAGFLLQADVGVACPPVAHAGQAIGQFGHQRHLQAATARFGALGHGHGQAQAGRELHQRGLLHRQRHGRHHALAERKSVTRARKGVARLHLPAQCRGAVGRRGLGHAHVPGHFLRLAWGNLHAARGQIQRRGARTHLHLHRRLGGVAQRELGTQAVALAHQGRQAADDLQVLRGANLCLAGAKAGHAHVGHGHHLEAGQSIVQRHADLGAALGI